MQGLQGVSDNLEVHVVSTQGSTLRILMDYLDMPVLVKLKGGRGLKGVLKSYDQHLNILLSEAEEINAEGNRRLGMVLIRGDNVVMVSPAR